MHELPRRFINFFTKSAFTNSEQESLNLIMLGDPVLRKRSEIVSFDSGITTTLSWLTPLSRDMSSLMHKQYGAGLAAPQIGRSLRMFLMDETDPADTNAPVQLDPVVVINPKILKLEGGWEFDFEGCLSVPLLAALVPRAAIAHVSYIDGSGTAVSRQLHGWAARIFQHEVWSMRLPIADWLFILCC
jgi:peptide deformylase